MRLRLFMRGSEMKLIEKKGFKQFISCVIFLALVWTVFVRCTYLFRNTDNNIANTSRPKILGFYLEEANSLDVVFVGGSNAHQYWDPMLAWHEYGFTSYVYGVSNMTADVMQYCLKDIRKKQNPVVIVVDVRKYLSRYSTKNINDASHRNFLDSLDFGLERLAAVNYVRELRGISVKDAITEFIDLIYYHNNKSVLASELNWAMWDNRLEEPPYNGYYYKGSRIVSQPHQFFEKPEVATDEISPLKKSDERALRDFLTYCRENNIPIMLTASPYVLDEKDAKELNMIAMIADEYNVPFMDVNRHLKETDFDYSTDFYNSNHTNIFGMEKYTRYIADYLKEHYSIPDQHDDILTEAWDELYIKYEEDAKNIKDSILTAVADKMRAITDEVTMRVTSDAAEWLSLANNGNMTTLIIMDQKSEFSPSLVNEQLLKIYGLTTAILAEGDHYFCVYSGKVVNSSASKSSISGKFGSRSDKLKYSLSIGEQSQMIVGDRNYIDGASKGLHMVAFDNNTYDFVDSVCFTISADGELHLEHDSTA